MTHIDHQINRLMESLSAHGLYEPYSGTANTYVCFVSDHGEMLGDHHMFRKGYPYEGSARVPLLLAGPQASGIQRNSVQNGVVALRDIMPTLLDCAGLPIPDTVDGKSLLPMARGEQETVRDYLHGEHTIFGQSLQWITNGHEKYIWLSGDGHEQLFDLDHDPTESHDIARSAPGRVALLREQLVHELTDREEGFVNEGRLVSGRPVHPCLSHIR
jgi:arylsulfatase A-like enzyme